MAYKEALVSHIIRVLREVELTEDEANRLHEAVTQAKG